MKRGILVVAIFIVVPITILSFTRDGAAELPASSVADLVLIDKSERTLTLIRDSQPLKTYRVSLGSDPVGHKQQEGDGRTPEGVYTIDFHKRDSAFHRALHISYPNAADIRAAEQLSVAPGGDIMIHGLPNGLGFIGSLHRQRDWTEGCVAVTNQEIEEIWRAVPDGTPVRITSLVAGDLLIAHDGSFLAEDVVSVSDHPLHREYALHLVVEYAPSNCRAAHDAGRCFPSLQAVQSSRRIPRA